MSGVERGVGYPDERASPVYDSCGLDGVDVLSLLEARFLIMDNKESALETLFILFLFCGGKDKADKGLSAKLFEDSMDSILDS